MNEDLFEAQLQEELRQMFQVDTQTYLQDYITKVSQLNPQSWQEDIQDIYRAIHTIKGGAVTVAADAILYVARALEDILSDLRFLEIPPSLEDKQLSQYLIEAGELLAASLSLEVPQEEAEIAVSPSLARIKEIHHQIQTNYLSQWDESRQLQVEFAQQGFGLVILDLQMAIEKLELALNNSNGKLPEIPSQVFATAEATINQLRQIGQDLKLESAYEKLLQECENLLTTKDAKVWVSKWPDYFNYLQQCAKSGGEQLPSLTNFQKQNNNFTENVELNLIEKSPLISTNKIGLDSLETELQDLEIAPEFLTEDTNLDLDLESVAHSLDSLETASQDLKNSPELSTEDTALDLDVDSVTEGLEIQSESLGEEVILELDLESVTESLEFLENNPEPQLLAREIGEISSEKLPSAESAEILESNLNELEQTFITAEALIQQIETRETSKITPSKNQNKLANIKIPISLARANQNSENLVEVLLSARACSGLYMNLQSQLTKIFNLAEDSVNYITRLRQIQDDYALLNTITESGQQEGLNLERYRQGYTTINRLLEISLRLAEVGAEANKIATSTHDRFESLERNILSLEQTVQQSRVIPFKTLAFRARAIIRDLVTRYGKPVQLIIKGEEIELDAGITATLEPVLLHLLRNAYDHAIESPETRIKENKPQQGTIILSLQRRGTGYQLTLQDDGKGINPEEISQVAKDRGMEKTNTRTPEELLAVLSQPGFTSSQEISDISGRGVGMDVVTNQIRSLGGKIALETKIGQGTTFKFEFPTPRLLVPCVLLHRGNYTFAIPVDNVLTTALWSNLKTSRVKDKSHYTWEIHQDSSSQPGLDIIDYWLGKEADYPISDTAIGVCIGKENPVWLLVDTLGNRLETVINPLPSPLLSPLGLMGVSLQIDGNLVPVLDGLALAEELSTKTQAPIIIPQTPHYDFPEKTSHTILVVDDAALMRRRIEASLQAYGYEVQTCADGLEAWNWIQSHPTPALLMTDLEMPQMDGFTLIQKLRSEGIPLPIVVISSRLSEEWNKEAQRLGANDYLTKGFSTNELINKVEQYLSFNLAEK